MQELSLLNEAFCSYWSDPVVLEKMSKVMGDVFKPEDGAPAAPDASEGEDGEDEEDGEEEADGPALHNHASAGKYPVYELVILNV